MATSTAPRKQFTVVTKKRVIRVSAKSVQHLTQALRSVGIAWQGIHEDKPAAEAKTA